MKHDYQVWNIGQSDKGQFNKQIEGAAMSSPDYNHLYVKHSKPELSEQQGTYPYYGKVFK